MANSDNISNIVRPGATLMSSERPDRYRQVITTPQELRPDPDMFTVVTDFGYRMFGRLTGRTRRRWGMACPTIELFEIETVVIDDAIWGVPGEPVTGTFVTRPENIIPI